MKYLIIITLLFGLGCKKEANSQERTITITGYNCAWRMNMKFVKHATKNDNGYSRSSSEGFKRGETYYITNNKKTNYDITITGDSADFSLLFVINGNHIYHQSGKVHELKF